MAHLDQILISQGYEAELQIELQRAEAGNGRLEAELDHAKSRIEALETELTQSRVKTDGNAGAKDNEEARADCNNETNQ